MLRYLPGAIYMIGTRRATSAGDELVSDYRTGGGAFLCVLYFVFLIKMRNFAGKFQ